MEAASLQHRGDSFSYGWLRRGAQPSLERLADGGLGHSFGSSRNFIDMDPAELFSMRWTALPPATDFDFGVPGAGDGDGDSGPPSPMLVSASQIIRNGRLLPCEPVARSGAAREHGDDTTDRPPAAPPRPSASSPLYHSAHSTPVSLSSCSSTRSTTGRRCGRPPSWKILLRYLRFLMPLYKKIRTLRRFSSARPRVAPGSPSRPSTSSSLEWCHGSADTAVRDAILYCKKSSGQDM